jgi:cytochrome c oxidase assembly protein subunit 15
MTMVFVLRSKNSMRSTKVISIVAATVVFGQIALGATVITERLHAVLVTAHLALGLVLYSSLIFVVINTYYTNLRLKLPSASATLSSDSGSVSNGKRTSVEYSPDKSANL